MRFEAEKQIQARPYERTGKRRAHRNGTRPRLLKTIHGEIELDKPQIREFSFKTKVFERYSRVEESVRVAVAESYLEGVSTRKVEKVFSKFGLDHISASEVSRIAKKLDKQVKEFLDRPIEEPVLYLFLDASYFKVRTDGRYITIRPNVPYIQVPLHTNSGIGGMHGTNGRNRSGLQGSLGEKRSA